MSRIAPQSRAHAAPNGAAEWGSRRTCAAPRRNRGVGLRHPAPHVKPRCRVELGYVAAHHAEFYGILELGYVDLNLRGRKIL